MLVETGGNGKSKPKYRIPRVKPWSKMGSYYDQFVQFAAQVRPRRHHYYSSFGPFLTHISRSAHALRPPCLWRLNARHARVVDVDRMLIAWSTHGACDPIRMGCARSEWGVPDARTSFIPYIHDSPMPSTRCPSLFSDLGADWCLRSEWCDCAVTAWLPWRGPPRMVCPMFPGPKSTCRRATSISPTTVFQWLGLDFDHCARISQHTHHPHPAARHALRSAHMPRPIGCPTDVCDLIQSVPDSSSLYFIDGFRQHPRPAERKPPVRPPPQ